MELYSTDPDVAIEAKRLYTEALKTLQLEEVKGEKKTAEIVDYLRKAAQLGHKTSTKLLGNLSFSSDADHRRSHPYNPGS